MGRKNWKISIEYSKQMQVKCSTHVSFTRCFNRNLLLLFLLFLFSQFYFFKNRLFWNVTSGNYYLFLLNSFFMAYFWDTRSNRGIKRHSFLCFLRVCTSYGDEILNHSGVSSCYARMAKKLAHHENYFISCSIGNLFFFFNMIYTRHEN